MGLYFGGLPIFGLFSKDPVSEKFLQMSITVDLGIFNNLVCLRESTLCIKSTKTLLASASNSFTCFPMVITTIIDPPPSMWITG